MSRRWLYVRINDGAGMDQRSLRATSLWWLALAAGEETLQGGLMSRAWLRLFRAQLSSDEPAWLQWRGDLGESAEIRRAYSALYGRYATRGLLQALFGFRDFVPLRRNITTTPGGIRVQRNAKGDIPDWIAWDPAAQSYVLGEAKGNLTGRVNDFLWGAPPCLASGKQQFDRVDVTDSAGVPVTTADWVGANLWATDTRNRRPVFVAWDPSRPGRVLSQAEQPMHAEALSRRWLKSLADGFGYPNLRRAGSVVASAILREAVTVRAGATPDSQPPRLRVRLREGLEMNVDDVPSGSPHEGRYIPALITGQGLVRLRGDGAFELLKAQQKRAQMTGEPVVFLGLPAPRLTTTPKAPSKVWLSDHGIVGPSGLAAFDLRKIEIAKD